MLASTAFYTGLIVASAGLISLMKPIRWLRIRTRLRGLAVAVGGLAAAGIALALPAWESRIGRVETRLDEFAPAWQFREFHSIRIAAPPDRVFDAIRRVRADEIFLFRTLTWIRRGGRPLPPGIFNAGGQESLIDLATKTSFARLADDFPRELVVGTVVVSPTRPRGRPTPEFFRNPVPPGYAVATMNFLVSADGEKGSLVSTETRVFARGPSPRRQFAAYWRVIYPGSAIIRRMWLRAIERRAVAGEAKLPGGRGAGE